MIKCCKTIERVSHSRLAGTTALFWASGDVLTVSFLNGTESQKKFVMETLKEFDFCSIGFKRVDKGGMVRITFNEWDGAWSYIGKDILDISPREATMNLGWLDKGVVLHEFGHTLGFIHEHQNPKNPIIWNRPVVIAELSKPPNNWDLDTIEHNIFEKYDELTLTATDVDSTSIMMYPIPSQWTLNGFSTKDNQELSIVDKGLISKVYPKEEVIPEPPVPPVPPAPVPVVTDEEILVKYLTEADFGKLSETSIVRIGKMFDLPMDIKYSKSANLKLLAEYLYEN